MGERKLSSERPKCKTTSGKGGGGGGRGGGAGKLDHSTRQVSRNSTSPLEGTAAGGYSKAFNIRINFKGGGGTGGKRS